MQGLPGTIRARRVLLGASTPWYLVRLTRGLGTSAASLRIGRTLVQLTTLNLIRGNQVLRIFESPPQFPEGSPRSRASTPGYPVVPHARERSTVRARGHRGGARGRCRRGCTHPGIRGVLVPELLRSACACTGSHCVYVPVQVSTYPRVSRERRGSRRILLLHDVSSIETR